MQLLKSPELRSSQLSQTQRMYMLDYPPDAWAISPPALDDLTKLLVVGADPSVPVAVRRVEACCATLVLELTRVCAGCQVSITLDVKFDRRAPATALVVEGQYSMVLNASLCRDMIRNLDEAATSKRPTGSGKGTEVGDPIVLTELYPYVEVRHVPGVWWADQCKNVWVRASQIRVPGTNKHVVGVVDPGGVQVPDGDVAAAHGELLAVHPPSIPHQPRCNGQGRVHVVDGVCDSR